ncbi:hypothetical protein [Streptomyces sp. NBC_01207]|uniref:hypothetical protein n=1 Tax=Streptomyces sp. NBC_01207 TaxID=2903772 RepID=UPI002E0E13CD|nr:hypothetical protein OG457_48960 [Streptomyces sp. NBC_01207]
MTHVGAREYDAALGQFLSVDPVLSLDQNQSLNGYSYANNIRSPSATRPVSRAAAATATAVAAAVPTAGTSRT